MPQILSKYGWLDWCGAKMNDEEKEELPNKHVSCLMMIMLMVMSKCNLIKLIRLSYLV